MPSQPEKQKNLYISRINKTIDYINSHLHLSESLSLNQLSSIACFSPFHFHRIFSAIVGESPGEYINRLRMEKAANMITKSESLNITEIASQCGFHSPASFSRAFHKHYGIPPRNYKGVTLDFSRLNSTPPTSIIPKNIQVNFVDGFKVAYVSTNHGYEINNICLAYFKLFKWANANQLFATESKIIGISFDDPRITPKNKCRFYACISLPEKKTPLSFENILQIPGNLYAIAQFSCPILSIQAAYAYLYSEWLPKSGYEPALQPGFEQYHQVPQNINEVSTFDIFIPVAPL